MIWNAWYFMEQFNAPSAIVANILTLVTEVEAGPSVKSIEVRHPVKSTLETTGTNAILFFLKTFV